MNLEPIDTNAVNPPYFIISGKEYNELIEEIQKSHRETFQDNCGFANPREIQEMTPLEYKYHANSLRRIFLKMQEMGFHIHK